MKSNLLLRWPLPLALAVNLLAQAGHPIAPGSPSSPSLPGGASAGASSSPLGSSRSSNYPDQSALPLYLSGKVAMEDGTPPPEPVVIQLFCKAYPRPLAYTDSKGNFSANVTDKMDKQVMMIDASDPYSGAPGINSPTNGNPLGSSNISNRDLMGCTLQASLAGFRSTSVDVGMHQALDNPDIGTLFLRRIANTEGLTISATSALAPKDARKSLEKARNDELKSKWPEAEKELQKAVTIYPKYAAAWLELGNVQQKEGQREAAQKSYNLALAADPKFVSPWMQLALMDAGEQKWKEVAEDTDRLLRLNPVDFPLAWTYNALANYNLTKMDLAEKSAREGLLRDAAHHYPTNSHVLGLVLAQKHDYPGSIQNLRDYLHYAPNAPDSVEVKRKLDELEKAAGPETTK